MRETSQASPVSPQVCLGLRGRCRHPNLRGPKKARRTGGLAQRRPKNGGDQVVFFMSFLMFASLSHSPIPTVFCRFPSVMGRVFCDHAWAPTKKFRNLPPSHEMIASKLASGFSCPKRPGVRGFSPGCPIWQDPFLLLKRLSCPSESETTETHQVSLRTECPRIL